MARQYTQKQIDSRFKPGDPRINRKGRPGRKEKYARFQKLYGPALAVIAQRIEAGDREAAQFVLSRIVPAVKPIDKPVHLPELLDALPVARTEKLIEAAATGKVTPSQAKELSALLADASRIRDSEAIGYVLSLIRKGHEPQAAIAQARSMAIDVTPERVEKVVQAETVEPEAEPPIPNFL